MNLEVDRSLTSHRLSRRDRAPAYRKPRINPSNSSAPATSHAPDRHPLRVTRLAWQAGTLLEVSPSTKIRPSNRMTSAGIRMCQGALTATQSMKDRHDDVYNHEMKNVQITIDENTLKRVDQIAKPLGLNRSEIVRQALRDWLHRHAIESFEKE